MYGPLLVVYFNGNLSELAETLVVLNAHLVPYLILEVALLLEVSTE